MKRPSPSEDSKALHQAISAVIKAHGRGGLAMVARETGMTSSALRKRLQHPGTAFDACTLRAVVLVMELRRQTED